MGMTVCVLFALIIAVLRQVFAPVLQETAAVVTKMVPTPLLAPLHMSLCYPPIVVLIIAPQDVVLDLLALLLNNVAI
jgi:hypothetical protein